MSLIRLENVSKQYRLGDQDVAALKDISLSVEAGVFLAIAGPSGSGKSTLLNLIGCIDTASQGRVLIDGNEISGKTPDELADLRARTIGFVFQTFNLLPVLSAEENVEYPLLQFRENRTRLPRVPVGQYGEEEGRHDDRLMTMAHDGKAGSLSRYGKMRAEHKRGALALPSASCLNPRPLA